jgi:peptidylprolyl isomerase
MKYRSLSFSVIAGILLLIISCSANKAEKTKYVTFTTSEGIIKLRLYNNTPGHKENMIKLVKEGFYDGIKFHRVINEFMIQAGDPSTREDLSEESLSSYEYTIPAEINKENFHKKGVIAAARMGDKFNPDRNSSGTQFYIVQGKKLSNEEIAAIENRVNAALQQGIFYKNLINEKERVEQEGDDMSDAEIQEFASVISYDEINEMEPFVIEENRKEIYRTIGGTPHLDQQYTVFGEIVEGLEIVVSIAAVDTDRTGKPAEDIIIIKAKITNK